METIGHHTCEKTGARADVVKEAPFLSIHKNGSDPKFLGTGYYYWDYNKQYAITYGRYHYPDRGFYVVETKLNLPNGIFFDLAGNRMHLEILKKLKKRLEDEHIYGHEDNRFYLGTFIEILKQLEARAGDGSIFPYKAIRCIDLVRKKEEQYHVEFVEKEKVYSRTDLDPKFIICLIEKNGIVLQGNTIIHEENAKVRYKYGKW